MALPPHQMFPNLDHFVSDLSVTKTSASPCVGIGKLMFITLDPIHSFSQMSPHYVETIFDEDEPFDIWLGKIARI